MESNINHIATTYAFVATVYNSSKNFFEQFIPLLEYYFADQKPEHSRLSISSINEGINSTFGLTMPQATLMKLLFIMKKQDKVEINGSTVTINKDTLNLDYINKKQEIEDDLDDLYSEFMVYLRARGVEKNKEEIKELLMAIVYNNVAALSDFFGHSKKTENLEKDDEKHVERFFNEVVYKNDKLKHIVASLLFGAQKTYLLNLRPSESEEFVGNNFVDEVILDSNFILRLLNLQDKLNCCIAQETFEILKKKGVVFKVLSITIQEINSSISSYLTQYDSINTKTIKFFESKHRRFSGFTAALMGGLIHKTDLLELGRYMTLEKKLVNLGIEVRSCDSYHFKDSYISSLMDKKARNTYTIDNAEHDLSLIRYCEELRKKRNPRNANKIWVLTCDSKLASWNREIKADKHVCISEGQLSSIMWINCSENEAQINRLIAALTDSQAMSLNDIVQFQKEVADYIEARNPTDSELQDFLNALIETDNYAVDSYDNENFARAIDELTSIAVTATDSTDEVASTKEESITTDRVVDEIEKQKVWLNSKLDEISNVEKDLKAVNVAIRLVSIISLIVIILILGLSSCVGFLAWKFGDFDVLGWAFGFIVPGLCLIVAIIYSCIFGKEFNVQQLTFDIACKVCKNDEVKQLLNKTRKDYSLVKQRNMLMEKKAELKKDLLKIEGEINGLKKIWKMCSGDNDDGE